MSGVLAMPAKRPCASCPYRLDVPSGVWSKDEYEKLPLFDGETGEQSPSVFCCHQQDGRLCAGWAGVHDMGESFGLRMAVIQEVVSVEDAEALLDYTTDVPLFATGREAAEHGLTEVDRPSEEACKAIDRVEAKRRRKRTP